MWETKDSIYNTCIQLGDIYIYIYAHISTYESDQCAQTGDVQQSKTQMNLIEARRSENE